MGYNTIEEYSAHILVRYKENNGGKLKGYLSNPKPSQIRDACLQLYKEELNKADKEIIRTFFGFSENENGANEIEQYKLGKLKAVSDFLKEKSNSSNTPRLNLIALLVDFPIRPFAKFQKIELSIDDQNLDIMSLKQKNNLSITESEPYTEDATTDEINMNPNGKIEKEDKGSNWSRKIIVTISITISSVIALYFGINWIQDNGKCMAWSVDHYEKTECGENGVTLKYNQDWVDNFRKIELDSTMTFFKDGEPLFWYSKTNNTIEFFTRGGTHPVSGKELYRAKQNIIRKYVLKE
ncbi:hypothetical protein [uncultured Aquimarina sp.]|uniref:hypothetical protein n=1 Tax=uncultured Aquimarina sp. TaxID=575652 RepID=UPI0026388BA5|nr:hypothetical protein [uncultured Aquimarina sp.]